MGLPKPMTPDECETFAPCDMDWQQCARAKIAAEQHRRDMLWFVSELRARVRSEHSDPWIDADSLADEIERAAGLKK